MTSNSLQGGGQVRWVPAVLRRRRSNSSAPITRARPSTATIPSARPILSPDGAVEAGDLFGIGVDRDRHHAAQRLGLAALRTVDRALPPRRTDHGDGHVPGRSRLQLNVDAVTAEVHRGWPALVELVDRRSCSPGVLLRQEPLRAAHSPERGRSPSRHRPDHLRRTPRMPRPPLPGSGGGSGAGRKRARQRRGAWRCR
jgi:hypothetical protein